jgi:RAB protein geranylgeranyltransferase component A
MTKKLPIKVSHSSHNLKTDNLYVELHVGLKLDSTPMKDVYKHFGLEPGTQDFIGHAMALHQEDS